MAQRHIIEPYGHTIAGRRSFVTPGRFFCLRFKRPLTHYWEFTWKPQVSDQSRRLGEYVSSKDRVIIDNTHSSVRPGRLAIYRYVYVRVVGHSHSILTQT